MTFHQALHLWCEGTPVYTDGWGKFSLVPAPDFEPFVPSRIRVFGTLTEAMALRNLLIEEAWLSQPFILSMPNGGFIVCPFHSYGTLESLLTWCEVVQL